MPEEQPVAGHRWNQRANAFLSALGWRQIGDSNVDVACSQCRQPHGLDSVFVYQLPNQLPQLVFVETKEREWKSAHKAELEEWSNELLGKMQHVPSSPDFVRKFPVPSGVTWDTGLIVLWINDEQNFDCGQFAQRLRAIRQLPEYRKNPKRVFLLANSQILILCAIVEQLNRLRNRQDQFRAISFSLPAYGALGPMVTEVLPLESVFSKLIFATAEKCYREKTGTTWHPIDIVFYTGAMDYESLSFLNLALRRFSVGVRNNDLYLYFAQASAKERSAVAQFRRELQVTGDLVIERLVQPSTLPGWLDHENRDISQ